MIWQPIIGKRYQIWYNPAVAPSMPHHGKTGTVLTVGRGRGPYPINVELLAGNEIIVVPRSNLREIEEAKS